MGKEQRWWETGGVLMVSITWPLLSASNSTTSLCECERERERGVMRGMASLW